jgi:hypothetical protein
MPMRTALPLRTKALFQGSLHERPRFSSVDAIDNADLPAVLVFCASGLIATLYVIHYFPVVGAILASLDRY